MKPIAIASLLFVAAELSVAIPYFPHNRAISDQTRNLLERAEASDEVRRLSKYASPVLSRSLDFLKSFVPKNAKRKANSPGDQDDKLKPKERPSNDKDLAGEFPNVGLKPSLTRPTSPPNPFDTANGRPFTGHGPVVAETTDMEGLSSPSTTHKPCSTHSVIPWSSNPVPEHRPSSVISKHVPHPSTHPKPPHNSTSHSNGTHHGNGSHHHNPSEGSYHGNGSNHQTTSEGPHHGNGNHHITTHKSHHKYGSHPHTTSCESHRDHGPHATPAPGWINGNLNLIPPALLKFTSFMIRYSGHTVTEPVPLGVPTPSWNDFNPVAPNSLKSKAIITYQTVARTKAISRQTPVPERDDTMGTSIAPSPLSLSSFRTIASAATTASFSRDNLSVRIPEFKGPKE